MIVHMDAETAHWVAFSVFPGIGPVRFGLMLERFKTAYAAWHAPVRALREIGLSDTLVSSFASFRKTFDLEDYLGKLKALGVVVLPQSHAKYPELLKQIPDAPFLLYVKARTRQDKIDLTKTIAVVGTRNITHYGAEVTRNIVTELVSYGFTIVSGLAYGVDQVAHETAIEMGGKTIAVLGCGIDIIAPPSNARLYHAISAEGHGAIVSEMPLGLRPNKGLFPARNRIISGLSLGVVVTEGADDSGALITARNAAEQGREVFAVPGPITSPYSKGPAKLLKNGAKLVESVADILEELNMPVQRPISESYIHKRISELSSKEEKIIVQTIAEGRMHIDQITREANLTTSDVAAILTILEMKGIVKDFGEKVYGINE